MAESNWDDVGRNFADLGKHVQDAWEEAFSEDDAEADLKDAGDKVKKALEGVAEAIHRVTGSPEIHDAARTATASVAEAIAATLHQVASHLEHQATKAASSTGAKDATAQPSAAQSSTDDVPPADLPHDDVPPASGSDNGNA